MAESAVLDYENCELLVDAAHYVMLPQKVQMQAVLEGYVMSFSICIKSKRDGDKFLRKLVN